MLADGGNHKHGKKQAIGNAPSHLFIEHCLYCQDGLFNIYFLEET